MNITLSENDHKILTLLAEGKKPKEIKIGTLSTTTIYGRIRNLRLEFGVKTTKELIEAYVYYQENSRKAKV